ncbi:hypothetical protein JL722_14313 [Aureococcus anophagefferens]|nr:hypothetical protein JL722_14313 [Aureococcus anophagefferens]
MDLERRLAYYLPRLEATMAAAESAVAELERAREGFAPARWFGAYLAAQDALALHVTGEVRGAATLENFKYRDARLVEARYYSAKTYSARPGRLNEALRRLAKVLDEQPSKQLRRIVERLGLALDGLLARKDDRRRRESDSSDDDLFEGDLGALKSAAGADAAALASSRDRADDEAARAVDEPARRAGQEEDGDEYADLNGWRRGRLGDLRRRRRPGPGPGPRRRVRRRRRRRLAPRARSRLGGGAALELAAALRAAERAGLADEEERCHVDAGLNWLALAQGRRSRARGATAALVEFEACRGLCESHGFTDALGRARHNAGLAFLEVPDLGAAAREFAAARATFEAVLAGAGKGSRTPRRRRRRRRRLRALLCDALLGVAVARRDLGDDAGFRDAAGKYLGAGGGAALPAEEAATQSYEPWSQSDEALTMPFELKQEPDDAPRPAARAPRRRAAARARRGRRAGAAVHLRLRRASRSSTAAPRRRGGAGGGGTGTAAAAATAAPAAATAAPATAAAAAARGAEILISLPFFSVQIPLGTMCRLLGRKLTVKILQSRGWNRRRQ